MGANFEFKMDHDDLEIVFEDEEQDELELNEPDSSLLKNAPNKAASDDDEFEWDAASASDTAALAQETEARQAALKQKKQADVEQEQQDAESRRKEAAEKSRLEEEAAQQRVMDEQAKASAALTAASNTHTAINKANDDLVAEPVEGVGATTAPATAQTAAAECKTGAPTVKEGKAAQSDWAGVEEESSKVQIADKTNKTRDTAQSTDTITKPVTIDSALRQLLDEDLSKELSQIQPTRPPTGFCDKLFRCFSSSIDESLVKGRNNVFALAKMQYSNTFKGDVHFKMLRSIFVRLSKGQHKMHVARTGGHWVDIGFQGNDPSTDIRGTGMLGVLQQLYLVSEYPHVSDYIQKASCWSRKDVTQFEQFPFVITGFAFTQMALEALRNERLTWVINSTKDVWVVVHQLFCAGFLKFAMMWNEEKLDVHGFDKAKTQVCDFCKHDPVKAIDEFVSRAKCLAQDSSIEVASANFDVIDEIPEE